MKVVGVTGEADREKKSTAKEILEEELRARAKPSPHLLLPLNRRLLLPLKYQGLRGELLPKRRGLGELLRLSIFAHLSV